MQNYKELLETFPEARPFLKRDLASFRSQAEEKNNEVRQAVIKEEESGAKDKWAYEMCRENRQAEYKDICKKIKRLEWALNPRPLSDGSITDEDIERAKQVPLTEFVEFNSMGYAQCKFHNEKTSSMYYYKKQNRWWCFGACSSGGDVIELIMRMNSIPFLDAVRLL